MCVYLGVCVQNKKKIHIHMKLFCGMEILNSFTKTLKLKPYIERKKNTISSLKWHLLYITPVQPVYIGYQKIVHQCSC